MGQGINKPLSQELLHSVDELYMQMQELLWSRGSKILTKETGVKKKKKKKILNIILEN